jgi:succinate dehydrogenase / fumarate reductase flavoprotein subunit
VFPANSHTVAAQGGIAASLANMGEDDWRWHMYDTVKAPTGSATRTRSVSVPQRAGRRVRARALGPAVLAHQDGKIYQRPFGGMTTHCSEGTAQHLRGRQYRPRHTARCTARRSNTTPSSSLNLRHRPDHGRRRRLSQRGRAQSRRRHHPRFRAKMTILATGGCGRTYFSCTSAHICTGDGNAMIAAPACRYRTWSSSVPPTGIMVRAA